MEKDRLAAFSDGVIAVIITIMVLEMKAPAGASLAALSGLAPVFLSYVLSFLYVAIYWNNHHHMLYAARQVNGRILWANMHLLFWLSLIPFATAWMGENHLQAIPTALYGFILLMAAIAYYILEREIIAAEGPDSLLAHAVGRDIKGRVSPFLYVLGIGLSLVFPPAAAAIYTGVALMWLVPDRRIEQRIARK